MRVFYFMLLVTLFGTLNASGQKQDKLSKSASKQPSQSVESDGKFRYVIIADTSEIQQFVNDNRDSRDIVVLMEDAKFNEENLKTLFFLLSKRYSDRTVLFARVYTSLEAIPTPEEYDMMDLYGPVENYRKYKNAYFSRGLRGNIIHYEIPGKVKLQQLYLKDEPKNEQQ